MVPFAAGPVAAAARPRGHHRPLKAFFRHPPMPGKLSPCQQWCPGLLRIPSRPVFWRRPSRKSAQAPPPPGFDPPTERARAWIASIQQSLLAEGATCDRPGKGCTRPHEGAPLAGDRPPCKVMLQKGLAPGCARWPWMLVAASQKRSPDLAAGRTLERPPTPPWTPAPCGSILEAAEMRMWAGM